MTPNSWDFHPDWETAVWYQRFKDYYLTLPGKRSVTEAYRTYRRNESKWTEERIKTIEAAHARWYRVAAGRTHDNQAVTDKDGFEIPVMTWAERAAAYDIHLRRQLDEYRARRAVQLAERQLETLAQARQRWEEMFQLFRVLQVDRTETKKQRVTVSIDGQPKEVEVESIVQFRSVNIEDFRRHIKTLGEITRLEYRALGEPEHINQNRVADNEGGELTGIPGGLIDNLAGLFQEIRKGETKASGGMFVDEDDNESDE